MLLKIIGFRKKFYTEYNFRHNKDHAHCHYKTKMPSIKTVNSAQSHVPKAIMKTINNAQNTTLFTLYSVDQIIFKNLH
jgi:hypothetical protein